MGVDVDMTAIKQVSISSAKHEANVARYLNDERALARSSQNIVDESKWAQEMARTRQAYGHDVPSRAGSSNVVLVHQVIAFNPDDASINGGKMTAERCMAYVAEYVRARYPDHEAVWVLHREHCKADGTDRFAVHIVVNRTNLETGKRLHEGRSANAKVERANAIRDMDAKWGLSQLRAGERNSRVHARQPSRAEREMEARGIASGKSAIREAVRGHVRDIAREGHAGNRLRELARRLDADGIKMSPTKRGKIMFERNGLKVSAVKLGRGFSAEAIAKGLGMEPAARRQQQSMSQGGMEL